MLETVFKGITFCWDGFKVRRLPYGTIITEFLGEKKQNKEFFYLFTKHLHCSLNPWATWIFTKEFYIELEVQLTSKLRIIIILFCKKKHYFKKDAQRLEKILDSDLYIKFLFYMYISVFYNL